jgi:capsular polysaccharide biosynthesis protein
MAAENDITQTQDTRRVIGVRDVVRRWPVIIAVMLVAVGAMMWSQSRQVPTYAAMTRIVIVPLAQWDETFLGTSLVRDSGDATRTAATVVAALNSPHAQRVTADYLRGKWTAESVAAAVKVSVFEDTNMVEIVATADNPNDAAKLADGFATATMADRWKTISTELDARIASVKANTAAVGSANARDGDTNPTAEAQLAKIQSLQAVRDAGADPTMRIDSTSAALPMKRMPSWAMSGLATVGGLVLGVLCAAGLALMRRPSEAEPDEEKEELQPSPVPYPSAEDAWIDARHR